MTDDRPGAGGDSRLELLGELINLHALKLGLMLVAPRQGRQ